MTVPKPLLLHCLCIYINIPLIQMLQHAPHVSGAVPITRAVPQLHPQCFKLGINIRLNHGGSWARTILSVTAPGPLQNLRALGPFQNPAVPQHHPCCLLGINIRLNHAQRLWGQFKIYGFGTIRNVTASEPLQNLTVLGLFKTQCGATTPSLLLTV